MLTIEHCDTVHLHLPAQGEFILGQLGQVLQGEAASTPATGSLLPALGEVWAGRGGRYAGTMPALNGKPGYHLVLADAQNEGVKFGPYEHDVTSARDHNDGRANTAALVQDAECHPAAEWAAQLRATRETFQLTGHCDFYLPAHNELLLMWICVPHLFKKEGWYWSSTQYSPRYAWAQDFGIGYSNFFSKGYEFRAVAVRRLEI
jgi:hypothetical protein